MAQCTATSKQSGERCKRAATAGRTVCYYHGGQTPQGLASPHTTRDGRYSKIIPLRMAARYEEARTDPALLELRDDVGLIDGRIADLIARVDTGESGAIWKELQDTRRALIDAKRRGDATGQMQLVNDLLILVDRGHADYRAWREVGAAIEQRRKLVESERKRLVEMQQMVTTERLMLLLGGVVKVIQEHIHDRGVLDNITQGIHSLLIIDRPGD